MYYTKWIILFGRVTPWYYYKAYLGALTSYAIVIYKTYGPPQMNLAFAQKLLVDENVEYLLLALYWYLNRTVSVTLLPFVVFSLFHVITYTRSSVIPLFFPSVASEIQRARTAPAGSVVEMSGAGRVSKFLGDWSSRYYSPALRKVGVWEVAAIGSWLVVGVLTLQVPILAPLIYFQFLRMRYALSAPTRAAFHRVRVICDHFLVPPAASAHVPGVVTDSYVKVRDVLVRMGSMITDPAVAAQQQRQQQR